MKKIFALMSLLSNGYILFVILLLVLGYFLPECCWEIWGQIMAFLIVFGILGMFIGLFF